jgi:hypothetical protein
VFVSSQIYTADLGGASGADQKCQSLADAAGLKGTFKAWIADSSGNPNTRLSHSSGPYVMVNGAQIAASWSALTTHLPLQTPFNLTEKGTPAPSGPDACSGSGARAWSNAEWNGVPSNSSGPCNNWTSSSGSIPQGLQHFMGSVGATDGHWSSSCAAWGPACGWQFPIYCFEQ